MPETQFNDQFSSLPYLAFDPESYPVFFQHLDQRLVKRVANLLADCWQQVGRLPDAELLANLPASKLATLWLSQFVPGLYPIGTTKPDAHGNWNYQSLPTLGSALTGRLWQSVPNLTTLEWICDLFGLTLVYYNRPLLIANFSYSVPIGVPKFHLVGDPDLIQWVVNWIEPNCYPLGTGLAGSYTIGSQYLPIVDANLIQIGSSDPLTTTEPDFNRLGWSTRYLRSRREVATDQIGWVSGSVTDIETVVAGEIKVTARSTGQLEGSGVTVGFASETVDSLVEGSNLIANSLGWTVSLVSAEDED
jgi:hypothetical protein